MREFEDQLGVHDFIDSDVWVYLETLFYYYCSLAFAFNRVSTLYLRCRLVAMTELCCRAPRYS